MVEWRTPPTDDAVLGELARSSQPMMLQAVLEADGVPDERAAFRLRRRIAATTTGTYVASCSFRTVVYKGLITADALSGYFLDLADERFQAPFAVFHQRFSTNTLPTWERAQPFRTLCHNGEINAVAGNINRMRARATLGTEAAGLGPEELFRPVVDEEDSDSGQLDSVVELLTLGGRDIRHAVAMTIPEAWEGERDIPAEVKGFYRYHASLMEPWDGPAGLIFTDGIGVGAALDRNGLRPLRWAACDDGLVVCCSEAGAVDLSGRGQVRRGRLGPGQMLYVSPTAGVVHDRDNKQQLAAGGPYARWAQDGLRHQAAGQPIEGTDDPAVLERRQAMFGYSREEMAMVLRAMANDAKEPTYSMGDDSPLPHLAGRPRPIHHYLRQRFAQVTNPPIDHLRERLVMSLRTLLGPRHPILQAGPESTELLVMKSFFVYPSTIRRSARRRLRHVRLRPPRRHLPGLRRPRRAPQRHRPAVRRGRGVRPRRRRHPGHRRRRRERRPSGRAGPAGHGRHPPPPGQPGPALEHQPGRLGRRRPRRPLHRLPARVRGRRHLPGPGPGDRRLRGRPDATTSCPGPRPSTGCRPGWRTAC